MMQFSDGLAADAAAVADTFAERYPDTPETVEYHEQLRAIVESTNTAPLRAVTL
jgi:hypothetical protein